MHVQMTRTTPTLAATATATLLLFGSKQQQQPSSVITLHASPLSLEDANLVNRYLGGGANNSNNAAASRRHQRRQQRRERQKQRAEMNEYTTTPANNNHGSSSVSMTIPNENPAVCLTAQCLDQASRLISRAFPDKPRETWWVPSQHNDNHDKENNQWSGLLAVRPFKSASSTTAGIALRMANRTGGCAVRHSHYTGFNYFDRNREKSLLFAPIRQPAWRAYSAAHYFDAAAAGNGDNGGIDSDLLGTSAGGGQQAAAAAAGAPRLDHASSSSSSAKTDDEIIHLFREYIQKWKGTYVFFPHPR